MKNLNEIFTGIVQAQETNAPATPAGQKGNVFSMFLPMILVFAIFYFLLIRPQSKQRKKHQELLGKLKKGDDVVTTSGIHGKIYAVTDNLVTLEIADNIRVKLDRQQVATIKQSAA